MLTYSAPDSVGTNISDMRALFDEDPRIDVVRVLGRLGSPISVAEMREQLVALGHADISNSTVARRMKEIEKLGLCHQEGREGRVLTRDGQECYRQLLEDETHQGHLSAIRSVASSSGLEQLLRIRRAVEPEAAFEFATNASEDDLCELGRMQDEYKSVVGAGGSHPRGAALDFHRFIAGRSQNPFVQLVLNEALHPRHDRVEAAMDLVLQQQRVHEASSGFHDALITALQQRDAHEAEQLMREHLDAMLAECEDLRRPGNENGLLDSLLEWARSSGS